MNEWNTPRVVLKVSLRRHSSTIPFSNAQMFTNAPRHLFSNHTGLQTNHTGKLVMSGDLSGIRLAVMEISVDWKCNELATSRIDIVRTCPRFAFFVSNCQIDESNEEMDISKGLRLLVKVFLCHKKFNLPLSRTLGQNHQ